MMTALPLYSKTPSRPASFFSRLLAVFQDFTTLSEDIKNQLSYQGDVGKVRNTRAGYARKDFKDKKQVFHYTGKLQDQLDESHLDLPIEAREFLKIARDFYHIAVGGLNEIIDAQNPYLKSIHFPLSQTHNHHLRFLLYDEVVSGDVLAQAHYDQSTFTVAVCESEPGLRIGSGPEDISRYQRDIHQSILFPGFGYLNLHRVLGISTEYLPAWHDVIQSPTESKQDNLGRIAIILFANPAHIDTTPDTNQTEMPLNKIEIGNLVEEGVLALAS